MMLTLQEKEQVIASLVAKADPHNRGWYENSLRTFWDSIIEGLKVGDNLTRGFRSLEVNDELQRRGWLEKIK